MKNGLIQIGGKSYVKSKVVMLPSSTPIISPVGGREYISCISLYESKHPIGGRTLTFEKYTNGVKVPDPQYLYFLTDEEVKGGD